MTAGMDLGDTVSQAIHLNIPNTRDECRPIPRDDTPPALPAAPVVQRPRKRSVGKHSTWTQYIKNVHGQAACTPGSDSLDGTYKAATETCIPDVDVEPSHGISSKGDLRFQWMKSRSTPSGNAFICSTHHIPPSLATIHGDIQQQQRRSSRERH